MLFKSKLILSFILLSLMSPLSCKKSSSKNSNGSFTGSPNTTDANQAAIENLNPCNASAALYLAPLDPIDGGKLPIEINVIEKIYEGERELLVGCDAPSSETDGNYQPDFCRISVWTDGRKERIYAQDSATFTDAITIPAQHRNKSLIFEAKACVYPYRVKNGGSQCSDQPATKYIKIEPAPGALQQQISDINKAITINRSLRGDACQKLYDSAKTLFEYYSRSFQTSDHDSLMQKILSSQNLTATQKNTLTFANFVYLRKDQFKALCFSEALDDVNALLEAQVAASEKTNLALAQNPDESQSNGLGLADGDCVSSGTLDSKETNTSEVSENNNSTAEEQKSVQNDTKTTEDDDDEKSSDALKKQEPSEVKTNAVTVVNLNTQYSLIPESDPNLCLGNGAMAATKDATATFSPCLTLDQPDISRQKYALEGVSAEALAASGAPSGSFLMKKNGLCLTTAVDTSSGAYLAKYTDSCDFAKASLAQSFFIESSVYNGVSVHLIKSYPTTAERDAKTPFCLQKSSTDSNVHLAACPTLPIEASNANFAYSLIVNGGPKASSLGTATAMHVKSLADGTGANCLAFPLSGDASLTTGSITTAVCYQEAAQKIYALPSSDNTVVLSNTVSAKPTDLCFDFSDSVAGLQAKNCSPTYTNQKFQLGDFVNNATGDQYNFIKLTNSSGAQKCLKTEEGTGKIISYTTCNITIDSAFSDIKNELFVQADIQTGSNISGSSSDCKNAAGGQWWECRGKETKDNKNGLLRYGVGLTMITGGLALIAFREPVTMGVKDFGAKIQATMAVNAEIRKHGTLHLEQLKVIQDNGLKYQAKGEAVKLDFEFGKVLPEGAKFNEDITITKNNSSSRLTANTPVPSEAILTRTDTYNDASINPLSNQSISRPKRIELTMKFENSVLLDDSNRIVEPNLDTKIKTGKDFQINKLEGNSTITISGKKSLIKAEYDTLNKASDSGASSKKGLAAGLVGALLIVGGSIITSGAAGLVDQGDCSSNTDPILAFSCEVDKAGERYADLRSKFERLVNKRLDLLIEAGREAEANN